MIDNFSNSLFMQRIEEEENKRIREHARNWQYYRGEHKKPLRVKQGQADDNVILNLSQLVVDKGVSFLFGKEVEFRADEEGARVEEEDFLDETWEANAKTTLLQALAVNGSVTGHCFAKLVPQGIEYNGALYTRIVALDPSIVRVFWDGDDISRVLWYKIQYQMATPQGEATKKQIIERAEDGQSWTIKNYVSRNGGKFEQIGGVETWAYPFAPILDWQNLPAPNEYYGASDLDSIPDLNDAVNFVASDINRILKYHAHPKTWGRGFNAKELSTGVDDMIIVPNASAEIQNLEMQSDLNASRAYMSDLTSWLLRIARLPNVDPATVNVGALSGFALKILYGDLLEKTETKRGLYGNAITELNRRLQILDGRAPVKYQIVWQSPLPENRIEQSQQLNIEVNQLGTTSKETAAQELGRDWATEQERKAQEATEQNNIGATLLRAFEQGQGLQ